MRTRLLVAFLLVVVVFASGGVASNGSHASARQWTVVNFVDPVMVRDHLLMGPYLVVHDDERMAKGEPCTSIYRFDPARGPQGLEVEFVCFPEQREICSRTTFSVRRSPDLGINVVTEYQFAGDPEVHGVPAR